VVPATQLPSWVILVVSFGGATLTVGLDWALGAATVRMRIWRSGVALALAAVVAMVGLGFQPLCT
jgi:hypothetical protein